jgi:hypothetical protein
MYTHLDLVNLVSPKIVYCYTSCTRQSIVEREGLEHDERSEECSKVKRNEFNNMSCETSVI